VYAAVNRPCFHGRCAINRQASSKRIALFGLLLLALVITACQQGNNVEPTHIPTAIPPTPTIRSTALPQVPTAPPLGEGEARQIVIEIALFGENANTNARRAANQLQQALQEQVGLEIKVEFVSEETALAALCSGAPRAAWVNPFTFVTAEAECDAVPVFAITRGRPQKTVGRTAEIIARADITRLSQLKGQVFCRSYDQDYFTSWVFPSLYIAGQGVDPITDLSDIKDYPDNVSLGNALYVGDCAAAALPPDEFEDFLIDLSGSLSTEENPVTTSDLSDVLHVIQPAADTAAKNDVVRWQYATGVIPYEVLAFPPDSALPEALKQQITETISGFFGETATSNQRLNDLLSATGLIPVDANSYQNFSPVVINAKWDMAFSD
jgi:ABC-type phosphate/phosphonate transport system substrate-binding protein